jgi:hypothetical protein
MISTLLPIDGLPRGLLLRTQRISYFILSILLGPLARYMLLAFGRCAFRLR